MTSVARKLFMRKTHYFKSQRNLSVTACLRGNDDYVIKSPLGGIVIPEMRFLDRLWKESSGFLNHVAVECAETKKAYTYKQLHKTMATFATSLHKKLGLKENDVVAVMLSNRPEFPVLAFGTMQAGCILTTYNPIYKEAEVIHLVNTTSPKVIVTEPACYNIVLNSLANAKCNAKIVLVDNNESVPDGAIKYSEIAESGEADYAMLDKIVKNKDDVAVIPFSSGTTGLPKGVEITYKNLLASIEVMQHEKNDFPKLPTGDFQDVVPCVLPFYHIYGMVVTLIGHLAKGCKMVCVPKFSAGLYFDILKNQKASLLYVVPPIAILLGKHPDVTEEHFKHVRHLMSGAALLSASDIDLIVQKAKNKNMEIGQGFGATETTSLATTVYKGSKPDLASCGQMMASVEMKFVDPLSGKAVPPGEQGELLIRAPIVMKGYHKNEEATKESLTEDGFYKTGDFGYYKPDRGLYITDRIKELIKVKGLQVAPAELEGILRTHPAVQDAAVIGVPHEYFGEAPKAFVIKKNGVTITPEDIQNYVASKVASFKRIEEVVFVDTIPKTSSGKILRRELKKMYT